MSDKSSFELLTAHYQQWCKEQDLPEMSADEMLHESINGGQRRYLTAFILFWDVAINAERVRHYEIESAKTTAALEPFGFVVTHTGGGCTALGTQGWCSGKEPAFLITSADDASIPIPTEAIALGFYRPDQEHTECEQEWTFKDLADLLDKIQPIMKEKLK